MPYIKLEDIHHLGYNFTENPFRTVGELNYVFTQVLQDYVADKGINYQTINDIVGALECAKAEFLRRIVGPYEDLKKQENGDVYMYDGDITQWLKQNPTV